MPNNDAEEHDDKFKEIVRQNEARRAYHALVGEAAQRTAERLGLSLESHSGPPKGFRGLRGADSFEWNGEWSFVFYETPGRDPLFCAMVDLEERRYTILILTQPTQGVFWGNRVHRIVYPPQEKRDEFAAVFKAEVETVRALEREKTKLDDKDIFKLIKNKVHAEVIVMWRKDLSCGNIAKQSGLSVRTVENIVRRYRHEHGVDVVPHHPRQGKRKIE